MKSDGLSVLKKATLKRARCSHKEALSPVLSTSAHERTRWFTAAAFANTTSPLCSELRAVEAAANTSIFKKQPGGEVSLRTVFPCVCISRVLVTEMRTLTELQAELQQARASLQQMENARKEATAERGSEVAQQQHAADAADAPVSDALHEGTTGSVGEPISPSAEASPTLSDTVLPLSQDDISGASAVPSTGANADVGTADRKEVPAADNAATADYLLDDESPISSSSPGVTDEPVSSPPRSLGAQSEGSHASSTAPAVSGGIQNAQIPQQQQHTSDGTLHHPGAVPPSSGHLPAGGWSTQATPSEGGSGSSSASEDTPHGGEGLDTAPSHSAGAPPSHMSAPHPHQQQQQQEPQVGGSVEGGGAQGPGAGARGSVGGTGAEGIGGAPVAQGVADSMQASATPTGGASMTSVTLPSASSAGLGSTSSASFAAPTTAPTTTSTTTSSATAAQGEGEGSSGAGGAGGGGFFSRFFGGSKRASSPPATATASAGGSAAMEQPQTQAPHTGSLGGMRSSAGGALEGAASQGTSAAATPLTAEVVLPGQAQGQGQGQGVGGASTAATPPSLASSSSSATSPAPDNLSTGTATASSSATPALPSQHLQQQQQQVLPPEGRLPSHQTGESLGEPSPVLGTGTADARGEGEEEASPVSTRATFEEEHIRQGGEKAEETTAHPPLHKQDALANSESKPAAEGGSASIAALSPPAPTSSAPAPHGQSQPQSQQRSYQPHDPVGSAGAVTHDAAMLGQPQQQGQAQWQVGVTADGGTTSHLPLSPSSAPSSVSSVTEQDREREAQSGLTDGMGGVLGTGTAGSDHSPLDSAVGDSSSEEARHEHLTSTSWPAFPSSGSAAGSAGGNPPHPLPSAATEQGHPSSPWMQANHHQQQYTHRNGSSESQPLPSMGQGSGSSTATSSSSNGSSSSTEGQGLPQNPSPLQGGLNTSLTSEGMTPGGGAHAHASNTTNSSSSSSSSELCGEMMSLYAEVLAQLTASGCTPPPPHTTAVASVHQTTALNASATTCAPCACAAAGGDVRYPHALASNSSGRASGLTGYENSSSAFMLNSTAGGSASCVCPPVPPVPVAGKGGQVPPTLLPLVNASQTATTAALAAAWAVAQAEIFLTGAWEELQPALGPSASSALQQGAVATEGTLSAALSSAKDLWHAQVSAPDAPVGHALATLVSTFFRQRHAILALLAYGPSESGLGSLPIAPFPDAASSAAGGDAAGFLGVGEQQQPAQAAISAAQPLLPLLLRPWAKPVLDGSVTLAALLLLYVLLTLLWPLLDLAWAALTCRCLCPCRWASRSSRSKGGALSHSDAASAPALQGSGSERSPEGKKGPGGGALYTLPKGAPTTPLPIGRNAAGMGGGGGEQQGGERRASTGAAPSLAPPAFMQVHSLNNTSQVPTRAARTGSAASQPPSLPFGGSASMPPPTLSKGSSGSSTGSGSGFPPTSQPAWAGAQHAQQAPPVAPSAAGTANNTKIPLAIPPHLAKKLMQQGQGGLSQSMSGTGSHAKTSQAQAQAQAVPTHSQVDKQGWEGSNSSSTADGGSTAPPMSSMFMQPPTLAVGPVAAGSASTGASSGAGANGLIQGQGGPRAGSVGPRRSGPGPVMPLHSEPSSSYGPAQGSLPLSPSSATGGAGGGGWGTSGSPWTGSAPAPVSPPLSPVNLHGQGQGQWGGAQPGHAQGQGQGGGMAGLGPRERAASTGQGSVSSTGGGGGTGGPTRGPPRAIQGPLFATPQPPRVAAAVTQAGPGLYPAGKGGVGQQGHGGQQAAVRQQA